LDKIGKDEVAKTLLEIGVPEEVSADIFRFLEISGTNEEIISILKQVGEKLSGNKEMFDLGVEELSEVVKSIELFGVPDKNIVIDLSIARGLDYYTGTVYETKLTDYPQVGSVCSGGRFDNLAEKYSDKKFPGVGISIGLTRLFSQLKDAGIIDATAGASTPTRALVIPMIEDMTVPFSIASKLRNAGVPTEVYFDDVKPKVKLAYANKLEIPYVILIGEDELSAGKYMLKDMVSGEQELIGEEDLIERLTS
jgi:histidyl-tRNA synthetase